MNESFYVGAMGARMQMDRLNVHSNNTANVNTYGFKAEKSRFVSVLLQTDTDYNGGSGTNSGYAQDYMINGEGLFALLDLGSGEVTYTRNGAFKLAMLQGELKEDGSPKMFLSDGDGRFVLDQEGEMIEVTDPSAEYKPGVFDFVNKNGMEHLEGTRLRNIPKNGEVIEGTGEVLNCYIEQSNVDLAEEVTKLIESQRAYTMALKMVQTSDEIETTINNLRS